MKKLEIQICQIAPCGANCAICMSYLKKENGCPGCRGGNESKPKTCIRCRIKNCEELVNNNFIYCYECSKFPCTRIKQLDNRYQRNYNFSMIENLINIERHGIDSFIQNEKKRWICSKCGGIISVHRGYCTDCGKIKYYHKGTKRAPIK